MAKAVSLLTPRDLDVLQALDYSPLTARQLLRLGETFACPFTTDRKLRARLHLLVESGRANAFVLDDILLAGQIANARNPKDFVIVGESLASFCLGKKATCFYAIKDDVVHAGATYEDAEVIVDRNLVTSRKPEDLPAFMRACIGLLAGKQ